MRQLLLSIFFLSTGLSLLAQTFSNTVNQPIPDDAQARRSVESGRRNALDWLFFRRWRLSDGWLSPARGPVALEIFHDPLAIAMRRAVMRRLHPEAPFASL